ncbi:MAG: hypothetical protein WCA11_17145 [Terracidiphilus sp.]
MIVEIEGLTKIYDSKPQVVAEGGVDPALKQGEIFAPLGPNRAGKTSTTLFATTRSAGHQQDDAYCRGGRLGRR